MKSLLNYLKAIQPLWFKAYYAIPAAERDNFERLQQQQILIELDKCHGSCLLEHVHGMVANALDFFHGRRAWVGDYVVMPNHVHLLVQPFPGVKLEEWLYSIKRYTSKIISRKVGMNANRLLRKGHLWQTESFDRIVRSCEELARIRRYILKNPSRLRPGSFALSQKPWLDEFV